MSDETQATGSSVESIFPGLITEQEYARPRRRSPRAIRRERAAGKGPKVIWLGGSPHYRLEAIREWLLEQEQPPSARPPSQKPDGKRLRARRQRSPERGPRICAHPDCAEPVDLKTGRPGPKPKYCRAHTTSKAARRRGAEP